MGNKLPIEFVQNAGDDFFLNQRGAKVFYDESRQPLLPIAKGKNVYKVLSIGFGNTGTPMVTIESGRETVCYKLPYEYSECKYGRKTCSWRSGLLAGEWEILCRYSINNR